MIKMHYDKIVGQIEELKNELSLENVKIIPLSATEGDNVTVKSENITWYDGEPLLEYLENVDISEENAEQGFLYACTESLPSKPQHSEVSRVRLNRAA